MKILFTITSIFISSYLFSQEYGILIKNFNYSSSTSGGDCGTNEMSLKVILDNGNVRDIIPLTGEGHYPIRSKTFSYNSKIRKIQKDLRENFVCLGLLMMYVFSKKRVMEGIHIWIKLYILSYAK